VARARSGSDQNFVEQIIPSGEDPEGQPSIQKKIECGISGIFLNKPGQNPVPMQCAKG
jgi:hypothetical protein